MLCYPTNIGVCLQLSWLVLTVGFVFILLYLPWAQQYIGISKLQVLETYNKKLNVLIMRALVHWLIPVHFIFVEVDNPQMELARPAMPNLFTLSPCYTQSTEHYKQE